MQYSSAILFALLVIALTSQVEGASNTTSVAGASTAIASTTTSTTTQAPEKDDCDKCGPTRLIGCRTGRCYYKCIRRCLGKDNKFYYESLKFNFAGQR